MLFCSVIDLCFFLCLSWLSPILPRSMYVLIPPPCIFLSLLFITKLNCIYVWLSHLPDIICLLSCPPCSAILSFTYLCCVSHSLACAQKCIFKLIPHLLHICTLLHANQDFVPPPFFPYVYS